MTKKKKRTTTRDHFDEVVAHLARKRGVNVPQGGSGFGKSALRVDGKIFAMLVRDEFVVKLPTNVWRR